MLLIYLFFPVLVSIWIYMLSSLLRIHEHILPEGLLKLNYAKCLTKVSWNFFSVSFPANLTTMHNFLYFYFSAGHNWKLVVLYPPTRPFSYLARQGTSITTMGSTKPHLPFIIKKESLLLPTDHDEGGSSNIKRTEYPDWFVQRVLRNHFLNSYEKY